MRASTQSNWCSSSSSRAWAVPPVVGGRCCCRAQQATTRGVLRSGAASNGKEWGAPTALPAASRDRSRSPVPGQSPGAATTTATPPPPSPEHLPPPASSTLSSSLPISSPEQGSASSDDEGALTPGLLEEEEAGPSMPSSPLVATISILGIAVLLGGGYVFKDQIKGFLEFFITAVDDWGALGYVAYALVYAGLEVLAVPAIPLTMTAGVIFGTLQGTLLVSVAGTLAATIAFLIARYAVRDKVRKFAYRHPKFKAIDKAIGKNGLKFVTLLRLSPLLPLAASNYLYGLTSVDLGSYVLGSWIGMLPGTYAYVHAGAVGRAVLMEGEGSLTVETWQIALGLGATLFALGFVGRLAKKAIDDVEEGVEPSPSPEREQPRRK